MAQVSALEHSSGLAGVVGHTARGQVETRWSAKSRRFESPVAAAISASLFPRSVGLRARNDPGELPWRPARGVSKTGSNPEPICTGLSPAGGDRTECTGDAITRRIRTTRPAIGHGAVSTRESASRRNEILRVRSAADVRAAEIFGDLEFRRDRVARAAASDTPRHVTRKRTAGTPAAFTKERAPGRSAALGSARRRIGTDSRPMVNPAQEAVARLRHARGGACRKTRSWAARPTQTSFPRRRKSMCSLDARLFVRLERSNAPKAMRHPLRRHRASHRSDQPPIGRR
jgi:hypothetical protein